MPPGRRPVPKLLRLPSRLHAVSLAVPLRAGAASLLRTKDDADQFVLHRPAAATAVQPRLFFASMTFYHHRHRPERAPYMASSLSCCRSAYPNRSNFGSPSPLRIHQDPHVRLQPVMRQVPLAKTRMSTTCVPLLPQHVVYDYRRSDLTRQHVPLPSPSTTTARLCQVHLRNVYNYFHYRHENDYFHYRRHMNNYFPRRPVNAYFLHNVPNSFRPKCTLRRYNPEMITR